MQRILRSLISLMATLSLVLSFSVTAMASENIYTEETVVIKDIENQNARASLNSFYGKAVRISVGQYINQEVRTDRNMNTIKVLIVGLNGIINLQFINQDTGDVRTFTAIGNKESSLTYVSEMRPGTWKIKVVSAQKQGWATMSVVFS